VNAEDCRAMAHELREKMKNRPRFERAPICLRRPDNMIGLAEQTEAQERKLEQP
jgi:hypothetical protein